MKSPFLLPFVAAMIGAVLMVVAVNRSGSTQTRRAATGQTTKSTETTTNEPTGGSAAGAPTPAGATTQPTDAAGKPPPARPARPSPPPAAPTHEAENVYGEIAKAIEIAGGRKKP